eukprot:TRINITY_DN1280_c0_g1_i1.p1 TRINITY_DN1280_c0_g1~~TRINITY_DN1280_c0_g1_i1.p1  ORF type:complete len:149 (-),score=49.77 TRINITY_DN1280_c0_g1_i1:190-636(-)
MSGHITQDWDPVVIRKKKPTSSAVASGHGADAARGAGYQVEAQKKYAGGSNHAHAGPANAAKIEAETENFHVERVSLDLRLAIQKGRQAKNMTQKQLATAINEKPQVVNDYESGRAIPNNQIMGRLERALGIKLRGKGRGKGKGKGKK